MILHRNKHSQDEVYYICTDASVDHTKQITTIAFTLEKDELVFEQAIQVDFTMHTVVAEAKALLTALEKVYRLGITKIVCNIDSECLFLALSKPNGKELPELRKETKAIRKACKNYHEVNLELVDRYQVDNAHKLCNELLNKLRNE